MRVLCLPGGQVHSLFPRPVVREERPGPELVFLRVHQFFLRLLCPPLQLIALRASREPLLLLRSPVTAEPPSPGFSGLLCLNFLSVPAQDTHVRPSFSLLVLLLVSVFHRRHLCSTTSAVQLESLPWTEKLLP